MLLALLITLLAVPVSVVVAPVAVCVPAAFVGACASISAGTAPTSTGRHVQRTVNSAAAMATCNASLDLRIVNSQLLLVLAEQLELLQA